MLKAMFILYKGSSLKFHTTKQVAQGAIISTEYVPTYLINVNKKDIPDSRLECTNHTLFKTKTVKIDTLFQTKIAKTPYIRE